MTNGLLIAILLSAILVLLVIAVFLQVRLLLKKVDLTSVHEYCERAERAVREEIGKNREELAREARESRQELADTLNKVGGSLNQQMAALTGSNDQKLERMRGTIEQRLQSIQTENAQKLDQMRATVDEKLQSTLEKRLGESFNQVRKQLEDVHRGLGEMQSLATGVGDLKRVLTNVKARGTWGEVQLGAMLEQVLSREQYDTNVPTKAEGERVEFAIKLPGRGEDAAEVVWLPIDAKFPLEDYQRLMEAQERIDQAGAEVAGKQLETRIKQCAKVIRDKYIGPPKTTDFGILFLPNEGLFAEAVRRTGLADFVQRECRVVLAGPTTLWSILNSLQMGFRTLAIEKRSSEVWRVLGAVKTEFGKFGDLLDGVKRKLEQASSNIEDAARKSRTIEKKLRGVQELPPPEAAAMLPVEALTAGNGEHDEENSADLPGLAT